MLPYQRAVNRVERRWRRDAILHQLWDLGPAAVYGGLLHYATGRTKPNGQPWDAPGWAKHAFKEIYGVEPRPRDRAGPKALPDFLIEKWVAGRKRKPPAKWGAA
jgi:hypothetical protein